jgi:hypothetical protein
MNLELHRPIKGVTKSWAIWQRSEKINSISPLIYFHKAKYVSEEKFEELMQNITIYFNDKSGKL